MINLRTLYPYTNESIDEINEKLAKTEFDGIVLPVGLSENQNDSLSVLRQNNFFDRERFISRGDPIELMDFLKKVDLEDKEVFLSVFDLFDALGGGGKDPIEVRNYETLKKAISGIYELSSNIVINNNLYWPTVSIKEFFPRLKQEFPNIDYAYTVYSRCDSVYSQHSIVARNISYYDIIKYINFGKKIYFPEFERPYFYHSMEMTLPDLLESYDSEREPENNSSFKEADITVISKEKKVLERVLEASKKLY